MPNHNLAIAQPAPERGVKLDPETLRYFVPLDNLGRRSLRHIVDHTRLLKLAQGDTLVDVGDTSQYTYYLLRGAVKLRDVNGVRSVVQSGTERGRYALANLLPRRLRVRVASEQALFVRIDRDTLQKEITWGQLPKSNGKTPAGAAAEDEGDWKLNLLRTPTFAKLPMANVQRLFEELEEVSFRAGQAVVREGEPGDYYYIIRSGSCRVVRAVNGLEVQLSRLEPSQSFGDEALLSDQPRNASVIMESDGVLSRLSKASFQELMHAPLVRRINFSVARRAVAEGKALLVDVRMEEEFHANRIPHALNIPLFMLHLKCRHLNKGLKYVLYCDGGGRSETAAFVMTRHGFDTYVLGDAAAVLQGPES